MQLLTFFQKNQDYKCLNYLTSLFFSKITYIIFFSKIVGGSLTQFFPRFFSLEKITVSFFVEYHPPECDNRFKMRLEKNI